MLFYIRWMIYIHIECLQLFEGREEFAFFMATMLTAKDVYPSWQKNEKSIQKNMLYQSGPWLPSGCSMNLLANCCIPRRLHPLRCSAVSGVEVKIWNCAQISHHSHIGNHTVSFFFWYDMAGYGRYLVYHISDRHRILAVTLRFEHTYLYYIET